VPRDHSITESLVHSKPRLAPLVLVVDDHADARELYVLYLRHAGIRAATAVDGADALVKARDLMPDVIVMDVMMPGITGIEAMQLLRADAKTRQIPVVVLTASHDEDTRRAALDAGCDCFLTKPCPPEELAAVIRRVVGD
jgi:CheY-like chemotaxis protein